MVGLPWSQHVAFLDDRRAEARRIRRELSRARCARSATIRRSLMFALGNEIPPGVVRWHGRAARRAIPAQSLRGREGGVAGQPVHLRQLSADRVPRSVVLRRLRVQRLSAPRGRAARVPGRLQHIAGQKPLLLAEAGADSIREGEDGPGRDHRDAHPRRLRRRRVRRDGLRLDRRMVARRPSTSRTGSSASSIASASRSRRPRAVADAFADAPFPRRAPAPPGRASRWSSAPTTPPTRSTTA